MSRMARPLALAVVALVLSCSANAATETVLHSFIVHGNGTMPSGHLIADAAGNLYGATIQGGAYEFGAVFRLSRNGQGGWTETVLYSFTGISDAFYPTGSLTLDAAGNLYGATMGGVGPLGGGAIFKLSPTANGPWTETILYSFDDAKRGFQPNGDLVFDKAGNLYGTTEFGGGYSTVSCSFDGGCGTVFKLSPSAQGMWTESVLYAFHNETGGWQPKTSVIFDKAGNLFGTTSVGGDTSAPTGVIFELSPSGSSWTETVLHNFIGGSDGNNPNSVVLDASGNIDGTTESGGGSSACTDGCGTVFQLSSGGSGSWTETILFTFPSVADGSTPGTGLVLDQSGNLYGTTVAGGANQLGNAFELSASAGGAWTQTVLWEFANPLDGLASSGVILGANGKLLGVTTFSFFSNIAGNGGVFELSNQNGQWSHTSLFNFPDTDGGDVQAGLVADSSGNFYGTTSRGGANGAGTVYRFTPGSGTETTLFNFATARYATVGSVPSTLIMDALGTLYGETAYGGPNGHGMVYEVSPSGNGKWSESVLHAFAGGVDGERPLGGLIFDLQGNLYGTTKFGGNSKCNRGCGTVFELSPTGSGAWTKTVSYTFSGVDGEAPSASLTFDELGNLYGTTSLGGASGVGTVFELSPAGGGWTEKVLYSFTNSRGDGGHPHAGVIFDAAGNLYGTTTTGGHFGPNCGQSGCGTVFQLSSSGATWTETVLLKFDGANGGAPFAPLTIDAAGNLYGTSENDIVYGSTAGSVFEISPSGTGWTTTVLHTFPVANSGSSDGALPVGGVIRDSSGNLFGTTSYGGQAGWGTIYEITP